jgi:uncharacterized protein YdcH (DUF465 family)
MNFVVSGSLNGARFIKLFDDHSEADDYAVSMFETGAEVRLIDLITGEVF